MLVSRLRASAGRGGCGEQVLERVQRVVQHALWRLGRVDRADALRLGARKLLIRLRYLREEAFVLALQAIGRQRALAQPLAAGRRWDAQQQRAVGLQAAGGEQVDRAHLLDAERAPGALVGQ